MTETLRTAQEAGSGTTARPMRPSEHADPAAPSFRAVFDAELPYVVRSLRRLGVADADVDDVAQDVFVAVHARFGDRDPSRPLRPWLFAFCCRTAANHRRLGRHRELPDARIDERGTNGSDPEAGARRTEDRELLLVALAAVPFERRTVLVMHDIDGFGAPVIAQTLEIPLNTVYSRLRVARTELETAVRRLRGEP